MSSVGARRDPVTGLGFIRRWGRLARLIAARQRRGRRIAVAVAAGLIALAGIATVAIGASENAPLYYVAIGASQTLGYQPTGPGVQRPTAQGYTNDLLAVETARWPGLQLVTFACPGIRVDMALSGRTTNAPGSMAAQTASGRCRRSTGSEIGTAAAFIRAHPGQVALVTVDLGFPDVTACLRNQTINSACVTDALGRVSAGLPKVISRLRAAGGSSLNLVGLNYEDPFVGYYVGTSDPNPSFANASIGVIDRLNRTLRVTYAGAGVKLADVSDAFSTGVVTSTHLAGWGTVPLDVQRICTLTWMCVDRNPHPNARGYQKVAAAVAARIAGKGP